jgi:hypothetical protein
MYRRNFTRIIVPCDSEEKSKKKKKKKNMIRRTVARKTVQVRNILLPIHPSTVMQRDACNPQRRKHAYGAPTPRS